MSTSSGKRKAAICATEFFTTEMASSERPFQARATPTAFSTALPAIATITSPANAGEISSRWIAGASAATNQSDTNAAAAPAASSSARVGASASRGPSPGRETGDRSGSEPAVPLRSGPPPRASAPASRLARAATESARR